MSDTADSCTPPRSTCRRLHALGLRCQAEVSLSSSSTSQTPTNSPSFHRQQTSGHVETTLASETGLRIPYLHSTPSFLPSVHTQNQPILTTSNTPTRIADHPFYFEARPSTSNPSPHRVYLVSVHHDERVSVTRSSRWSAGWRRAAWIATSAARVVRRA